MTENDQISRAKAVAATLETQLSNNQMPAPISSSDSADIIELGKRKDREGSNGDFSSSPMNGDSRKKHKIIIPEDVKRNLNIVGVLLGPKGSTLYALQDKSGAKISIRGRGSSKDTSKEVDSDQPLHVLIEGSDETIAAACQDIEAIFNDPTEAARLSKTQIKTHRIYIPEKVSSEMNILGVLIGPKASTLRAMQDKTGAKISIRGKGSSKEPKSDLDSDQQLHVLIEGTELAIAVATRDIEGIINDPAQAHRLKLHQLSEMNQQKKKDMYSSMGHHQMMGGPGYGGPPPGMYHGGSYGPGPMGMMPPMGGNYRPPFGMGGMGMAGMGGPGMGRQMSHGDPYEEEITVAIPNNIVGVIVGKQGSNLQRINQNFGVTVRVLRHDSIPGQVYMVPLLFKGPRPAIEAARKSVMAKVADRQDQLSAESAAQNGGVSLQPPLQTSDISVNITVPNDRVGLVIGKGGINIKNLQNRTGASVKIPIGPDPENPEVRTLTVTGSNQTSVDSALEEVQSLVQSGPSPNSNGPTITMRIPSDRVGLVLGKGGATVKEIHGRTGATIRIDIPTPGDPTSLQTTRAVTIYGPPEGAARAKHEIEQMIILGRDVPGGNYEEAMGGGLYSSGPGLVDPYRQQYLAQSQGQSSQQSQQGSVYHQPQYAPSTQQGPMTPQHGGQYGTQLQQYPAQQAQYPPSQYAPAQQQYGQQAGQSAQSQYGSPQPQGYGGSTPSQQPQLQQQYQPQVQPQYQPQSQQQYTQPVPQQQYGQQAPAQAQPQMQQYAQQGAAGQPSQYYSQQQYPSQQPAAAQPSQYAPQQTQMQSQSGYYQSSGQPQAQQYQQARTSGAAATAGTASTPAASGVNVDPTQYHQLFWQYAAYYGERVAREQYGAWSPPVGTAPPPGIVLPLPGQEHPVPPKGM